MTTTPLPLAANDNLSRDQDRRPGEVYADWKSRISGNIAKTPDVIRTLNRRNFPIDLEFRMGRISIDEMETADTIADYYEQAYKGRSFSTRFDPRSTPPGELIGAEHVAHAASILRRAEDAAGHLWSPMVAAVAEGKTMKEIGLSFDAANDNAPAIGREKVIDGLKLSRRELEKLAAEKAINDRRIKAG